MKKVEEIKKETKNKITKCIIEMEDGYTTCSDSDIKI